MGILIDLTAKECVDRLIEVVFHESHEESEPLGLYDIYDKFYTEIEQRLTELGENEL